MTKAKVEQWLSSTCSTFEPQAAFKARTAKYVNKALNADGYDVTRFKKYNSYTSDSYRLNACLSLVEKANSFPGNRKQRTLTFKPGTYKISNAIFIPSNTTLKLSSGTTINKLMTTGPAKVRASLSMFQTIAPTRALKKSAVKGFSGEKNIVIQGPGDGSAVINMMGAQHPAFDKVYGVVIGHASDVTVEGIEFRNNHLGHFLEVSASRNVQVLNNRFVNTVYGDHKAGAKANPNGEAINVDFPDNTTRGVNYTWGAMDRYGTVNLKIEGNYFKWQNRAVGTHVMSAVRRVTTPRSQSDWSLRYHDGLTIRNNIIKEARFDAFKMLNWRSPVIEGNLIDTIRTRVNASNGKPATAIISQGAENPTFLRNRFVDIPEPMLVRAYDSPHYRFTNRAGKVEALRSKNIYPAQAELQKQLCTNEVSRPSGAVGDIWRTLTVFADSYRSGSSAGKIHSRTEFPSTEYNVAACR